MDDLATVDAPYYPWAWCVKCKVAEEAVPLRMWNARSDGCVFCNPCAEKWFGLSAPIGEPVEVDEPEWPT